MISKEQSEYLDAISRELGEAMSPFQELLMIGFDIERFYEKIGINSRTNNDDTLYGNDDDEDIDPEIEYDYYENELVDGYIENEYGFDEDEEEYRIFKNMLYYHKVRKKYFA